jgi:hypothetical protein
MHLLAHLLMTKRRLVPEAYCPSMRRKDMITYDPDLLRTFTSRKATAAECSWEAMSCAELLVAGRGR